MARTTNQPSTATSTATSAATSAATRRKVAKTRADTDGRGSFDEHDRRSEDGRFGDNDERPEGLIAVQDEQDDEREDNREDDREARENTHDRGFGDNRGRDQRRDSGGYTEQDSWRAHGPAMSAGLDTFAPMLEAWKQVFKSWAELTETMVKVQQDAFASMISGAGAQAKDFNLGQNGNAESAFPGTRTTASTPDRIEPDRIEHDRR